MIPTKAARRYSAALLGYALETDSLESVLKDVQHVDETIRQSRELLLFLRNPIVKPAKKSDVLKELFGKNVSEQMNSMFGLIAEKSRFDLLPGITHAFIEAYRKHKGIIVAEVFYADMPDEKQFEAIRKAIAARTGKTVELVSKHKPDLVGGLVVKIDDTVIDGSVKHSLEQLEHLFLKAAI